MIGWIAALLLVLTCNSFFVDDIRIKAVVYLILIFLIYFIGNRIDSKEKIEKEVAELKDKRA